MNRPNFRTVIGTGSVEYINHMGDDLTVVNSARVSFNKESGWDSDDAMKEKALRNGATADEADLMSHKLSDVDCKLLRYLAKHKHWTPFAHPQITFRIKAPIPIRTQFFKHKQGFVENECSRRYVSDPPEYYLPFWRSRSEKSVKQGSGEFLTGSDIVDAVTCYSDVLQVSSHMYSTLVNKLGVCPEQARFALPQGVLTEWYWTGSLSAFARFFRQRIDPHAQWEIRRYAVTIGEFMGILFPESWAALIHDLQDIKVPAVPEPPAE
jgi:thymidylate synthase (FAD)